MGSLLVTFSITAVVAIFAVVDTSVVDVGVFVITASGSQYERRVLQAARSWALNESVLFIAAEANPNLGVEAVPCGDDHLKGMCCKTIEGFKRALVRFPEARWLVRAVDDTYVFVRQLAHELQAFNPSKLLYLGAASISLLCHFSLHASACAEPHAGGGGGFVLSRPLAEQLVKNADTFLESCSHDDIHLGHFLRYAFDVHVVDVPGILQEPRIGGLSLDEGGGVPRCPAPLPPPVYARLDDWGPLSPFVPLEATRLAMLHSDPELWMSLGTLPRIAAELPTGNALLAYADNGEAGEGRRVLGPHFEGGSGLGLCWHPTAERLSGYHGQSTYAAASTEALPPLGTLHWAAWNGHAALLSELLAARANPDQLSTRAPVQEFFHAIHFAAMRGHVSAVDVLLRARVDVSVQTQLTRMTALDILVENGLGGIPVSHRLRAALAAGTDHGHGATARNSTAIS